MSAGLLIDTEGQVVARVQDGQLIGDADPVVAGWFENGVPGLAGVQRGDTIAEHEITILPSDPFFLLAVIEQAERRDWTVVDETDEAEEKSEVGDKPGHPFAATSGRSASVLYPANRASRAR